MVYKEGFPSLGISLAHSFSLTALVNLLQPTKMSSSPVITISEEAKKVSFSDVEEIIPLEEESTEMCDSLQIRDGCIVTIESKTPSIDKDNRPFHIVDISIADGQLVAIVQDSQEEDELQYHVPVSSIKHRVLELREAVERLNSQGNYFKFDQDVIKFVQEVTGKTPRELKREKLANVATPSTESRKRQREKEDKEDEKEQNEENPAKKSKSGDEEKEEEQCTEEQELQPMEKAGIEETPTEEDDDQEYSFEKLIGLRFAKDGEMFFHVLWSTKEKTWEPWTEFKEYRRCIKQMVRREIRNGFQFTKVQKKTFEENTGMRLRTLSSIKNFLNSILD